MFCYYASRKLPLVALMCSYSLLWRVHGHVFYRQNITVILKFYLPCRPRLTIRTYVYM